MVRDTSQLLNLTPLQGMTSALTNSNFKINNNAIVNSNSSSGDHPCHALCQKEEATKMNYVKNILIADHSDTSLIGQLR